MSIKIKYEDLPSIKIKLLHEKAQLPLTSKLNAGADLYSVEEGTIGPGERKVVRTGISVSIPEGYYGRVAPRSGLAVKNGINVLAGVIDPGYRGEIMVVLHNTSKEGEEDYQFQIGDRIAQLIIQPYLAVEYEEGELDETDRGQSGFGSSGR